MKTAFIGLGKLGLPVAEAMAKHHALVGFDIEPRTASFPVARSASEAIAGAEIVFLALPTPHDPEYDGSIPVGGKPLKDFDYTQVKSCLAEIAPHLHSKQKVVLISTVLPGTVRRDLAPLVPNLIYNPYLIAMGTEVKDFLDPEMLILGSAKGAAAEIESGLEFYRPLLKKGARIEAGTWEEAEGIKIFYNTFISVKIGIVNMIQDVAMRVGHMNVDVVTNALAKSDRRIMSPAYMKAGMGDGGPCHPRDNIALRWLSERLELGYDLFSSIIGSREAQAANLAQFTLGFGKEVVILGKAFKPGVPYTAGSYSLLVAHYLAEFGGTPHFFDPKTGDKKLPDLKKPVYLVSYWEDWVREFPFAPGATIIDPWREPKIEGLNHQHYGNTRDA